MSTNEITSNSSDSAKTQTTRQHHQEQILDCLSAKQECNTTSEEGSKDPLSLPHMTFTRSVVYLLTAITYSMVTLIVMYYAVVTTNLLLIYIAIVLAATPTNPTILKTLFGLIRASIPSNTDDQSND